MNSLDSHLYSSIRRKKTKRNNRLSPSLSLSLPPVFPRTTREGNGGRIYPCPRIPPVHDTSRWRFFFPAAEEDAPSFRFPVKKKQREVCGSTSEVTRRVEVGWWLTLSLRASRRRRHLCATLPPPSPLLDRARPPRHTDPYEDAPSLVLGGHRMCFVSAPTELSLSPSSSLSLCISLFVSLSLSGNERSAPERSRTQGCWPAVTHPSAGCHSIYSLEDRAGGLEDDGIVAGWELWGRWELEISSLLDFDVDVGFSESRGRVWNAGPFFFFFFGRRLFVIRKFWVSRMGGWRILSFFFSFSYRCRSKMEVNKGIQFNLFVEM